MIFSFLLPREIDIPRRRRGGNVGIRRRCFLPDFQARWKEWKTRFWLLEFPTLSTGRHFHRAFHLGVLGAQRRGPCARWCFVSRVHLPLFFALGQKLNFSHQNLAPGSPRCDGLAAPRPKGSPLGAQAFFPPRSLRMDSPRNSMRWALCTRRSRMLSAKVGSPICSCHWATGSWLVRMVERV